MNSGSFLSPCPTRVRLFTRTAYEPTQCQPFRCCRIKVTMLPKYFLKMPLLDSIRQTSALRNRRSLHRLSPVTLPISIQTYLAETDFFFLQSWATSSYSIYQFPFLRLLRDVFSVSPQYTPLLAKCTAGIAGADPDNPAAGAVVKSFRSLSDNFRPPPSPVL